ncbi:hypothetical protein PV04_00426 [Phialophora macrospora]|uniref:Uncharacterized protein n=1 Tax=Phialophora macrospora TaxID=1851006 RepID=A0A0D2D3T2_9EURO|nr:hypothetical protein PV04_00426 [Phialophora macrospora]
MYYYVDDIEFCWTYETDAFRTFLAIMEDFQNRVIDVPQLFRRVTDLFHDHGLSRLLYEVNSLLPEGYYFDIAPGRTVDATITTELSPQFNNSVLEWARSVDPDQVERDVGVPQDEEGTVEMYSNGNDMETAHRLAGMGPPAKRQRIS